jgi:hypothetical protein
VPKLRVEKSSLFNKCCGKNWLYTLKLQGYIGTWKKKTLDIVTDNKFLGSTPTDQENKNKD